jgi:hypothetical protein
LAKDESNGNEKIVIEETDEEEYTEEDTEDTAEDTENGKEQEKETKTGKRKKGNSRSSKKGNKQQKAESGSISSSNKSRRTVKDQARCSFCNNSMLQSEEMNWHAIPNIKVPKNAEGEPRFKSPPGAPEGKVVAVFCDDCERESGNDETFRDFRTAVIERPDGKIENVPLADIARVPTT